MIWYALDAACLHYSELLGWLISGVLSMWWLEWWDGGRREERERGVVECKLLANCNIACPAQHCCTQTLGWGLLGCWAGHQRPVCHGGGGMPRYLSYKTIYPAVLSFHHNSLSSISSPGHEVHRTLSQAGWVGGGIQSVIMLVNSISQHELVS